MNIYVELINKNDRERSVFEVEKDINKDLQSSMPSSKNSARFGFICRIKSEWGRDNLEWERGWNKQKHFQVVD